ncbi:MAG: histidine kinase [Alphaproteobacteria bacterium]|nr:histidine kinase [Alphaproteobacteria bacterium]MBL7096926.1 histidine kinase [Alphaproteobacteria bacterium]
MNAELDADHAHWTAGDLAISMPTFNVSTTCGQVFEWFQSHRDQVAAAVVDGNGAVKGIVNRLRFLARYAQPYVPELYAKRSILKLANTRPLVVDEQIKLTELGKMLTFDWPDALRECFIVTRGEKYLGIGTCEALVSGKMHLLVAREKQLATALADAEAANRAKSSFLALMSHELRTPLNAIIGFSEVLAAELFGGHQVPRYREYSADIHHAGKHLLALINDILDLSKYEAGKMDLQCEPFAVVDLFRDCQRMVAVRAQESGIDLMIDAPAGLPLLDADRRRIKQILLNLLSNAIKFTPAGGCVRLVAETAQDGGVVLSVHDTGIGMTCDQIPLALEPFRQIDSPFSRTQEGTGLGLSLVKALTEQHDGRLTIDSAVNKGTSVRVYLPASRSVRPESASAAA